MEWQTDGPTPTRAPLFLKQEGQASAAKARLRRACAPHTRAAHREEARMSAHGAVRWRARCDVGAARVICATSCRTPRRAARPPHLRATPPARYPHRYCTSSGALLQGARTTRGRPPAAAVTARALEQRVAADEHVCAQSQRVYPPHARCVPSGAAHGGARGGGRAPSRRRRRSAAAAPPPVWRPQPQPHRLLPRHPPRSPRAVAVATATAASPPSWQKASPRAAAVGGAVVDFPRTRFSPRQPVQSGRRVGRGLNHRGVHVQERLRFHRSGDYARLQYSTP